MWTSFVTVQKRTRYTKRGRHYQLTLEYYFMLRWSVIFLIIAIIAALFGFTSIAGASIAIAKVLFFIFIVLFVIMLVMGKKAVKKVGDAMQTPPQQ